MAKKQSKGKHMNGHNPRNMKKTLTRTRRNRTPTKSLRIQPRRIRRVSLQPLEDERDYAARRQNAPRASLIVFLILVLIVIGIAIYINYGNITINQSASPTSNVEVKISSNPSNMMGGLISFSWSMEGNGSLSQTGIVYSTKSVSNPNIIKDYPFSSDLQCTSGCELPRNFSRTLEINSGGDYYYRAYAIVNGNTYFSNEETFSINNLNNSMMNTQ